MKKLLIINMIFLICMIAVHAQPLRVLKDAKNQATSALLKDVGGKYLDLTLPDSNFMEVSERFSSRFNLFVPDNNRLLCGFLIKSDVKRLTDGKDPKMDAYILVEVSRKAENIDCKTTDFKEVTSSITDIPSIISSSKGEMVEQVNQRLKALDIPGIQLNDPKNLGLLYTKEDAIAAGMIYKVQQGNSVTAYICSTLLIRLRERLLFVYIYKIYQNQTSLKEIISLTDSYASAMLTANPAEKQAVSASFWEGLPGWGRNALIGGGLGVLFVFLGSVFKQQKPIEEPVNRVTNENRDERNITMN